MSNMYLYGNLYIFKRYKSRGKKEKFCDFRRSVKDESLKLPSVPHSYVKELQQQKKKKRESEPLPVLALVKVSWLVKKINNTYNYSHSHTAIKHLDSLPFE